MLDCIYVACEDVIPHDIKYCRQLAARCAKCHLRGHYEHQCERFHFSQWMYAYEGYQSKNVWTYNPEKNIAVSVFPIPPEIEGQLLDVWSKFAESSGFLFQVPKQSSSESMTELDSLLCDAVETLVSETEEEQRAEKRIELEKLLVRFRQVWKQSTSGKHRAEGVAPTFAEKCEETTSLRSV